MSDTINQTAHIAASYLAGAKQPIGIAEIPLVISTIYQSLVALDPSTPRVEDIVRKSPAEIRKSITPDALICFEDGKPYRMLKRRLRAFNLTPEAYRAKYGLPPDYPMVAPNYSTERSALAKASGLGTTAHGRGKR